MPFSSGDLAPASGFRQPRNFPFPKNSLAVQFAVRYSRSHPDGADLNAGENTALWFACQSDAPAADRLAVAELLLDAGADVKQRCEEGSTALHFAAWRGPVQMVELLLSRGAQPWIADVKGHTPKVYAIEDCVASNKEQIIELFSSPAG